TLDDKLLVSLISVSWGLPEDQVTQAEVNQENAVFKQMAAQGQTVLVASGDYADKADKKTVGIQDPSSQPYVLAVGGTTLTVAGNGTYGSETTWNNSPTAGEGTGGGISTFWPIPSWQTAAIKTD